MLVLADCRIPAGRGDDTRRVHVFVDRGTIADITGADTAVHPDREVIDCGGMLLLPGAVDPHVHFCTPGLTHREEFDRGAAAAAAGGVTTAIDMPCTSVPPVTNARAMGEKIDVVSRLARVDYALWGGASGNLLANPRWREHLSSLAAAGVVGFKAYLLSGSPLFVELAPEQLEEVMAHARTLGLPVGLHAEDPGIVRDRTAAASAAGRCDWDAVADVRADPVEERAVALGIRLAERTGCALHVVHVGSGAAAERVREAKARGVDVTAETCPHFLAFTRDDLGTLGPLLKTAPIVKTAADRDALWTALADGTIDFVATDHAPCPLEEKLVPDVWAAYSGVPGVQTMLPFLLDEWLAHGRITLARLVEVASTAAARRWGLDHRKGSPAPGLDADFALVDTDGAWTVRAEDLRSKARWSPFLGRTFRGRIARTFVRGRLVYDASSGVVGEPGWGELLGRRTPPPAVRAGGSLS